LPESYEIAGRHGMRHIAALAGWQKAYTVGD